MPSMRASGIQALGGVVLEPGLPRGCTPAWSRRCARSSACSSMSSQTHPQNVQVAFFTTVSSISAPFNGELPSLAVRTGRQGGTFSPIHDRDSCPGCGAACTARSRSAPRPRSPPPDLGLGSGRQRPVLLGASRSDLAISLASPSLIRCAFTEPVSTGSTSTSQPLDVGMPVPSVLPPMSRHVGGP